MSEVEKAPSALVVVPLLGTAVDLAVPADVARAVADVKQALDVLAAVRRELVLVLVEESARQGTKTLRYDGIEAEIRGGPTVEYDGAKLRKALRAAGCPPGRINEAVVRVVSWKVNKSVLRQLARANPAYADAIEAAAAPSDAPYQASVKRAET